MNAEKIKKLQSMQSQVRTGGKGTARRKKKVVHKTAATDDKKLQSNLKKLSVTNIPGIEEVNMIKDDGSVIHFNNPKVQASVPANTFAINGHAENKQITDMLPGILNQLGAESLTHLKRLANNVTSAYTPGAAPTGQAGGDEDDDDDVPELVGDFDEFSKKESKEVETPAGTDEAAKPEGGDAEPTTEAPPGGGEEKKENEAPPPEKTEL